MTRYRIVLHAAGVILALAILAFLRPSYSQQRAWSDGRVDFGDDSGDWANDGECDDPRFEGDGSASTLVGADLYRDATDCQTLFGQGQVRFRTDVAIGSTSATAAPARAGRVERGYLEARDATLKSGEFADTYEFEGTHGGRATIDLRSGEFDTYLLVSAPSGKQFDNDDYEGDSTHSLLAIDLEETGTYRITVTSYATGETGSYMVAIEVGSDRPIAARMERNGALQSGDEMLKSGEFVDTHDFEGSRGQRVSIDLTSSAFDTYLILKDPHGEQVENDDADDIGTGHSRIERELVESGTYRVLVTSYGVGETGDYHLTIAPSTGDSNRARGRNVRTLTAGRHSGSLFENGYLEGDDIGRFDVFAR